MVKQRIFGYDVIRVVGMCFVVCVHALAVLDSTWEMTWPLTVCGQSLFFTANAMFFMVSGRFNLREQRSGFELRSFYLKKTRGIALPVVVLFLLRTLWEMRGQLSDPMLIAKQFARNSFGQFASMEYWFMFTLIGFLIVSPFLAHMVARFTSKDGKAELKAFIVICVLFNGMTFVAQNRGIDFAWSIPFVGFLFPYCLGPLIEDWARDNKAFRLLSVGAVAAYAATVLLCLNGFYSGAHDVSPFFTLLSVGLFAALLRVSLNWRPNRLVQMIAPHAFTVYMVHMVVLDLVSGAVPVLPGALSLATYVIAVVVTVACSIVVAVVLDGVLIHPLQGLFDRVASRLHGAS